MNSALIIARKELIDHARDSRGLASTALYTLMGPGVVGLVLLAAGSGLQGERGSIAMALMAAVFIVISAFSGGGSVAVDMIAGERERRSLLPLLMNAISRREAVAGKWLAASAFAACSVWVTLLAFVVIFAVLANQSVTAVQILLLILGLFPLALFSSAVHVLISTWSRSVKEGNATASFLMFAVMGLGMWQAFSPGFAAGWWFLVPIVGHQHILQTVLAGSEVALSGFAVLSAVSIGAASLLLVIAGRLFKQDVIVYGN